MLPLAWLLIVTPLDPVANKIVPNPPQVFTTEAECNTARESLIKSNMYQNWQGLTMAPLITTSCKMVQ